MGGGAPTLLCPGARIMLIWPRACYIWEIFFKSVLNFVSHFVALTIYKHKNTDTDIWVHSCKRLPKWDLPQLLADEKHSS